MRELILLQLNDLHGYLEPHCECFWAPSGFVYREAGGLARIKTLVDQLRSLHGNVLFCDGGDTFHGTLPVVASKGACLPPLLNRLGLSAMTGHWDFAYGPKELQRRVSELNYPFLAANVTKPLMMHCSFRRTAWCRWARCPLASSGWPATLWTRPCPQLSAKG